MQLPTRLSHAVKSGAVTIFAGDEEALQVKAGDNKIDLSIDSTEFLKDVIDSAGGGSILDSLEQLKELAMELKNEGLTITISYQGDRLVTIGADAKPIFSRLVTGTTALEINNMAKLLKLAIKP